MNSVLKLYLKEFIRAGSYFALFFLLEGLIFEGKFLLSRSIFFFFGIGFIWSLAGISMHIEQIKALGVQDLTDDILKSTQIRIIKIDLKEIELIEALLNDPIFGKMSLSKNDNTLRINSGITWDSLGVIITIDQVDRLDGEYVYEIKSRPRIDLGQPDFGKSLSYIMHFESLLVKSDESFRFRIAS